MPLDIVAGSESDGELSSTTLPKTDVGTKSSRITATRVSVADDEALCDIADEQDSLTAISRRNVRSLR
jgi:hypothetical protein